LGSKHRLSVNDHSAIAGLFSFCTFVQQLTRLQLTRSIVRPLCNS